MSNYIYNFEADSTGSYTITDNILSSPQQYITFKNNVNFPAINRYGNDETLLTFETSIKGQSNNPNVLACIWIGEESLPSSSTFSNSYLAFRVGGGYMETVLASYNDYSGASWDTKTSSWPELTGFLGDFVDLKFVITRSNNELIFEHYYKTVNDTQWTLSLRTTFASDYTHFSQGGNLNAHLFVRENNGEYVPYTDLTKTKIYVGENLAWEAVTEAQSHSGVHIQLRRDTAINWTTVNPTLLEGEVGVETDTNKIKIGDGTTAWNSLSYYGTLTSTDVTTALGYTPYDSSNPSGYITSSAIANMQTTTNLVTSVSSSSTDSQYPSAKLFYDTCGDIETLINAL